MPETIGFEQNRKLRRTLSKDIQQKFDAAKKRFTFGQDYRKNEREPAWDASESQYANEVGWDSREDTTADLVNVNVSFSTLATLVPFVSDQAPNFKVEPYSGDANMITARLLQAYLNRLWESDEMRGQVHMSNTTFDYAMYGDGFMFVGYKIEQILQYDGFGDVIEGKEKEVARFFVERVSPWDVWIDPYSDGLHNARWVARRLLVPVKEILDSDRYRVLDRDAFQGGFADVIHDDATRISELNAPDERGFVAIIEFYDMVDNYMLAWSAAQDSHPLRYIVSIQSPIVQMTNYRIPNSPYHMGELENIYSLQEELNKTRSQMITHRRRNVMKWMYRKQHLDADAVRAMQSSRVNDLIGVDGNQPFDLLVQPVVPQQLGEDSYLTSELIRNDINELTGINEYLRGAPSGSPRTATEATIIEGSSTVRTRHKLNQVEEAARKVGQLLMDITADVIPQTDFEELRLFITGREADDLNRIMGESADTDVVFTPTPETFQGKYVVFVEGGSVELRDPARNEQKFKEMFQLLIGATPIMIQLGLQDALPNMRRIMELWFEAAGVQDINSMFMDEAQAEAGRDAQGVQQQITNPGEQGGPETAITRNGPTPGRTAPGDPRAVSTGPPNAPVDSTNSGILPPQAQPSNRN